MSTDFWNLTRQLIPIRTTGYNGFVNYKVDNDNKLLRPLTDFEGTIRRKMYMFENSLPMSNKSKFKLSDSAIRIVVDNADTRKSNLAIKYLCEKRIFFVKKSF